MSNPDAIANTNAYRFRFNEASRRLNVRRRQGMLRSGNTLAALTNYTKAQPVRNTATRSAGSAR